MKILSRLLAAGLGLMLFARASANVITFDNLHGADYLPTHYAGLNWEPAWQYFDQVQSPYTASSGTERIFSYAYGGFIGFGQDVTFLGSWLASARADQQMWWEGYENGVKLFESQHFAGGTQQFINLNWVGVDYVKFVSTEQTYFVLDDITYEPIYPGTLVPEVSATALLLGLAVITMFSFTRRSRAQNQ